MSGGTQFAYRQGRSFMHGLDPISKMIWLGCTSMMIILLNTAWVQLIFFGVIIVMALTLARLTPGFIWRFSRYIYLLGGLMFVLQMFFVQGDQTLFILGPLRATIRGALIGAAAGFRVVNLASSSMIFLVTTAPRDLAISAHQKLKLPARATQALFLALRFLPLLEEEYADLTAAHTVRGAGAGKSIKDRIQRLGRFTVPYLFGALRRAQTTGLAMDSKAFGAYPTKVFYHQVSYPISGKVFAMLWVLLLIFSIYLLASGKLVIIGDVRMAYQFISVLLS
jgi:energy-coupling factor transport system permease protein